MSLQGNLVDFPVADVFQLIGHQRKTGALEISRKDRTLLVHFCEGAVVSARTSESRPDGALAGLLLRTGVISESHLAEARALQEDTLQPLPEQLLSMGLVERAEMDQIRRLATDEAIFELFLWDDGNFAFRPEDMEAGERDHAIGAEMVLLDALRMRDEWASVKSQLPDLSVYVTHALDIEGFRLRRAAVEQQSGMSARQLEKLFNLCNVRSSARRVIDLSRLGTFQGARGLVALLRQGIVRIEAEGEGSSTAAVIERAVSERPALTYAVLATALVLSGTLWVVPRLDEPGHPWPADALAEARAEATLTRLEAELETHRWLRGAYPDSLSDIQGAGGSRLAGVPLDQYSYARSGKGYSLGRRHP